MTITPGYWKTRDGRKVRILCVDGPSDMPVIGYFLSVNYPDPARSWSIEGRYHLGPDNPTSGCDLISPWVDEPKKRKPWICIKWWTDEQANNWNSGQRVKFTKIESTEAIGIEVEDTP